MAKKETKAQQKARVEAEQRAATMAEMPDYVKMPTQPLPVSGERVLNTGGGVGLSPAGSIYRKAPIITESDRAEIRAGQQRRQEWEATPEGQKRMMNIQDLYNTKMTRAQIYMVKGWKSTGIGPKPYDVQLPGMADPDAAPRPPRYEELTPEERAHNELALMKRGTSLAQIQRDFEAQLDQAHFRAEHLNANVSDHPYATTFYAHGAPRQRIRESSAELGSPQLIHAQMNAFTSPNTKFSTGSVENGNLSFPNDDAAKHAQLWVQQGHPLEEEISNKLSITGVHETKRAQGYTKNIDKAAVAYEQYHKQGIAPADWVTRSGASPWASSPKTGPYANSWSDSHPQFAVGDLHTGGGAGFPHLGTEKAKMYDEEGNVRLSKSGKERKEKSEREQAIEQVPFFHSALDLAVRQATQTTNFGSIRDAQAAQWGEEQIQRGEKKESNVYPTGEASPDSYRGVHMSSPQFDDSPATPKVQRSQVPGQTSLF